MVNAEQQPVIRTLNKSVSWVTPSLGRRGQLMYMAPLLAALSERCKEFSVIAGEYGGRLGENSFKIVESGAVKRLYWGYRNINIKGFVFIAPRFMRTLAESNADIFFLVEYSLTTLYAVLLRLLGRKIKLVLVAESRPLQIDGAVLAFMKRSLRRFIVRHVDSILTNNTAGRNFLINDLLADPDRIVAKPYLVSIAGRQANQKNSSLDRFVSLESSSTIRFLNVGQLIPRKGIQHFILACILLSGHELKRMHVDIVGEGDYRDELEKLVVANGLEHVFHFHGAVEYKELSDIYSRAHVFVFPTVYDYRALSPFEALSAGLPILSSMHDGGAVENVIEGENGFCIDPNDHEQFASALRTILSNPFQLREFSMKSLEIAKSYTIENAVNNMLDAAILACRSITRYPSSTC